MRQVARTTERSQLEPCLGRQNRPVVHPLEGRIRLAKKASVGSPSTRRRGGKALVRHVWPEVGYIREEAQAGLGFESEMTRITRVKVARLKVEWCRSNFRLAI